MTGSTSILIGTPATCERLERQLDLMTTRPVSLGWVVTEPSTDDRILGTLDDLEAILRTQQPEAALVSLPSVMTDLVTSLRTRLRKAGVADRFVPTLEDLVAGVGPRTHVDVDLASLVGRPPRAIDGEAIGDLIRGRCILVTGAGGSIGSELARIVASYEPANLILVDRSESALFEIDRQIARRWSTVNRKAALLDVVDADATRRLFETTRPDLVLHSAAHKHVPMMEDHPASAVDNNLFGTLAAAEAAHATGVERFVMISTDKAVNPSSVMGATKRLAELSIQDLNQRSRTAYAMVRFGNVLGSAGSVLEIWSRQIADGGPLTVTDERMTRYFMTIPEAAALVIQSAVLVDPASPRGEVFLLDMGEPVRIVDLAMRFAEAHGLTPILGESGLQATPGAIHVVTTGARPGEKLFEELAIGAEQLVPTRHPDINIWELPVPDRRYIESMVTALEPERRPVDPAALSTLIRRLVPESRDLDDRRKCFIESTLRDSEQPGETEGDGMIAAAYPNH